MSEEEFKKIELEELNSKIESLKKNKNELKQKSDGKFILMMLINCVIILISSTVSMGLIPDLGQTIATIISLSGVLGLTAVNTFIGYLKIKKSEEKFNNIEEQINYLEVTNQKMKNELKNTRSKNIDLKIISDKFDWRKHLSLMKTYNTYKKTFKKHYKKDDLYELLQYSGYDNQETYYLYEKTRNEVEKEKVLKKSKAYDSNIMDPWSD